MLSRRAPWFASVAEVGATTTTSSPASRADNRITNTTSTTLTMWVTTTTTQDVDNAAAVDVSSREEVKPTVDAIQSLRNVEDDDCSFQPKSCEIMDCAVYMQEVDSSLSSASASTSQRQQRSETVEKKESLDQLTHQKHTFENDELNENDPDNPQHVTTEKTPLQWTQHVQQIVSLSTSLVVAEILQNILPVVDLAAVGRLSEDSVQDLAAAALATAWFNLWHVAVLGYATALETYTAQAYGAQEYAVMARWTGNGLLLVAMATLPMGILLLQCEPVLRLWGQDPYTSRQAALYCQGLVPGLFPLYAYRALVKHLQTQNILWPAVAIGLVGNAFNLVANIVLISQWGLTGAPWATTSTRMLQLALVLLYFALQRVHDTPKTRHGQHKSRRPLAPLGRRRRGRSNTPATTNSEDCPPQSSPSQFSVFMQTWPRISPQMLLRHHAQLLREFGLLAGTGALSFAADAWSFEITTVLAGLLGPTALDAHVVTLNIVTFLYLSFPFAIGIATTIEVGKWIGKAEPTEALRAARASFGLTLVVEVVLCIVVLSSRHALAGLFLREEDENDNDQERNEIDPSVSSLVASLLPLSCILMLADAIHSTIGSILRGFGRQKSAMWLNLIGFWVLAVPIGAIFTFVIDSGVKGLWWGMIVGMYGSALLGVGILYFKIDWEEESKKAMQRISIAQT